jgi:hypothetical protein
MYNPIGIVSWETLEATEVVVQVSMVLSMQPEEVEEEM